MLLPAHLADVDLQREGAKVLAAFIAGQPMVCSICSQNSSFQDDFSSRSDMICINAISLDCFSVFAACCRTALSTCLRLGKDVLESSAAPVFVALACARVF